MSKSIKEYVKDAKSLSFDEFVEANPEDTKSFCEIIYEPLKNSKAGYIKVQKISSNPGYIAEGQWEDGYTDAFTEGIACYMSTPGHWFHTSVIQHIDWDKNEFTTMNSTYKFNFKPDENE